MHFVRVFGAIIASHFGLDMSDKHRKRGNGEDSDNPMPADAFREWRKRLGLKQKDAADLLGLKKRMIQYYETGSRSGKDVTIPKSIRLACYALEAGVLDYDGKTVHAAERNPHRRLLAESSLALDADGPLLGQPQQPKS